MRTPGRTPRLLAVLACAVALLTGCVTQSGGVTGDLSRAADSGAAAAATGHLALGAFVAGRSTTNATDVTLAAMIDEAQDAEVAVATAVIASRIQAEQRDLTLAQIREATDALVAARAWTDEGVGDVDAILVDLDDAAGALGLLSSSLDAAT